MEESEIQAEAVPSPTTESEQQLEKPVSVEQEKKEDPNNVVSLSGVSEVIVQCIIV